VIKSIKENDLEKLVKPYDHYKVDNLSDNVLLDNRRIVCSWYGAIKSGAETSDWSESEIVVAHTMIISEMLNRWLFPDAIDAIDSLPESLKAIEHWLELDLLGQVEDADAEQIRRANTFVNKLYALTGSVLDSSSVKQAHELISIQMQHLGIGADLTQKAESGSEYETYPDENKKYDFVVDHHHRGQSVHADFRLDAGLGKLLGWTINDSKPDAVKEPVTTLAEAKAIDIGLTNFKIDWNTGDWETRSAAESDKKISVSILSEQKQPEPMQMLTFEGVIPENNVGSTTNFPGVILIIDKGNLEFGAQRQDFHEYFVHGQALNYRVIYRKLDLPQRKSAELLRWLCENDIDLLKSDLQTDIDSFFAMTLYKAVGGEDTLSKGWLMIKPEDQTPYALTQKSIDHELKLPKNTSALPEKVKSQIPDDHKYWNADDTFAARAELIDAIAKQEIKIQFENR